MIDSIYFGYQETDARIELGCKHVIWVLDSALLVDAGANAARASRPQVAPPPQSAPPVPLEPTLGLQVRSRPL